MTPNFFKTSMPKSRKADFYLGCFDSSVFIDFNKSSNNLIYLRRISFDGYGCCNLDNPPNYLNAELSKQFLQQMESSDFDQQKIAEIVYTLIKMNKKHIWEDALEAYGWVV